MTMDAQVAERGAGMYGQLDADDQGDNGMHPPLVVDDSKDDLAAMAVHEGGPGYIVNRSADELRKRLQEAHETIAAVNRQNEELRRENKEVREANANIAAEYWKEKNETPKLTPGDAFMQTTLVVDGAGNGWWIIPEDRAVKRAW